YMLFCVWLEKGLVCLGEYVVCIVCCGPCVFAGRVCVCVCMCVQADAGDVMYMMCSGQCAELRACVRARPCACVRACVCVCVCACVCVCVCGGYSSMDVGSGNSRVLGREVCMKACQRRERSEERCGGT